MKFDLAWLNEDVDFSTEAQATLKETELIILFAYTEPAYLTYCSGRITISLHTDVQTIQGSYSFKTQDDVEDVTFELSGKFEQDDWEIFEGTWTDKWSKFKFSAICVDDMTEHTQPILLSREAPIDNVSVEDNVSVDPAEPVNETSIKPMKRGRQRAARSDARVRNIQRQIELHYGLPKGSVRLHSPDGKIHPSAKIGTLRSRWEDN